MLCNCRKRRGADTIAVLILLKKNLTWAQPPPHSRGTGVGVWGDQRTGVTIHIKLLRKTKVNKILPEHSPSTSLVYVFSSWFSISKSQQRRND